MDMVKISANICEWKSKLLQMSKKASRWQIIREKRISFEAIRSLAEFNTT
jgi:hypothetical protein